MNCAKKELSNDYYIMMAECMIHMLQDIGFTLEKNMRILDFGCGNGELVQAFWALGYDTYGVDIIDCISLDASHYEKIDFNPYKIPYSDNSFDLVCSSSVFEHTQNTEECFKEIYRILKRGGYYQFFTKSLSHFGTSYTCSIGRSCSISNVVKALGIFRDSQRISTRLILERGISTKYRVL